MLSYENVIQMLPKELVNIDQRARPVGSSRSEIPDNQQRSSKPKNGWHQAHFTSRKMKAKRNSPLQIIHVASNIYEMLSKIKDSVLPSRVKR
jgi:hypothetical protein